MRNVLAVFSFLLCLQAGAQLKVNDGTLTLFSGTVIKLDGTSLLPAAPFTLSNNQVLQSTDPVQVNGTLRSINQVLTFSSPVTFTGTLRLYFDPAGLNGNAAEGLKLTYLSAGTWYPSGNGEVNTTGNYIEEALNAKSFEGLTASAFYTLLPVRLLSFTARRESGNTVLLRWQTAEEHNNSHFTVERSSDGRGYTAIGTVPAAAATGPALYTFTDPQPLSSTGFYRLRQHDRDGNQQLCGVQRVPGIGAAQTAALYPNPVTGQGFTLDLKNTIEKPLTYTISNASGQLIRSGRITSPQQWLGTGNLPTGTYLLQLGDGRTFRFWKQ